MVSFLSGGDGGDWAEVHGQRSGKKLGVFWSVGSFTVGLCACSQETGGRLCPDTEVMAVHQPGRAPGRQHSLLGETQNKYKFTILQQREGPASMVKWLRSHGCQIVS